MLPRFGCAGGWLLSTWSTQLWQPQAAGCRERGTHPPHAVSFRALPSCRTHPDQRLVFYCRATSASTAPCTSRRMCCLTHCASYCAPCQPPLRAFSGWIRSPPPTGPRSTGMTRAYPQVWERSWSNYKLGRSLDGSSPGPASSATTPIMNNTPTTVGRTREHVRRRGTIERGQIPSRSTCLKYAGWGQGKTASVESKILSF